MYLAIQILHIALISRNVLYTTNEGAIRMENTDVWSLVDVICNINALHVPLVLVYLIVIIVRCLQSEVACKSKVFVEWTVLCVFAQCVELLQLGVWGLLVTCLAIWCHSGRLPRQTLSTDNKAVLVTGCDRGIGHALARALDGAGYQVFAGCLLQGETGERALRDCCSARLHTLQLDVTDNAQIHSAYTQVQQQLGNNKLWGVVNNAGICFIGNIETMSTDDIDKVVAVNFLAPVKIIKVFLPLIRQGKGRVVNITSNSGLAPVPQMSIYCGSKSALAMMSETLRYEMAQWGVHVSTIVPSGYRTGILNYDKAAAAERWWNLASDTVRTDYGKECFYPTFKYANHEAATSADLSTIVNTICEALSARHPRPWYYKGLLARSLPFLYLHLPTSLGDLVMKMLADWFVFKPQALQTNNNTKH